MQIQKLDKVNFDINRLDINTDLTVEDWMKLGEQLRTMSGAIQWWIGDWLNYGEREYGEMYSQALDTTGREYSTLATYKWVSASVESSIRSENLSWNHHREVAKLPKEEQVRWLKRAEDEILSVRDLRKLIRHKEPCQHEELVDVEVMVCQDCGKVFKN